MNAPRRSAEKADRAWVAYRQMRLLLDAQVARDLEHDSGLSMPDYEVLAAVASSQHECVRVSALAAEMFWSRSRLSRQLSRMEQRGLIAREACDRDGRGDDILLTAAGRRAVDKASPAHVESIRRHFGDVLSPQQLTALTDITETIIGHLGPERRD